MRRILIACAALVCLAACEQPSNVMAEIERAEKEDAARAAQSAAQSAQFMTQARARPGAIVTASGLVYQVTRVPPNPRLPLPTRDSEVRVDYEGRLADGTVFDASAAHGGPAVFPLNGVVPGFAEAILRMRPGEEIIAYLPPELAYGQPGQPPVIPPNAALQFRITLHAFTRGGITVSEPGARGR